MNVQNVIMRRWQTKTGLLLRRGTKPCQILGRTMDPLTFELETDQKVFIVDSNEEHIWKVDGYHLVESKRKINVCILYLQ